MNQKVMQMLFGNGFWLTAYSFNYLNNKFAFDNVILRSIFTFFQIQTKANIILLWEVFVTAQIQITLLNIERQITHILISMISHCFVIVRPICDWLHLIQYLMR